MQIDHPKGQLETPSAQSHENQSKVNASNPNIYYYCGSAPEPWALCGGLYRKSVLIQRLKAKCKTRKMTHICHREHERRKAVRVLPGFFYRPYRQGECWRELRKIIFQHVLLRAWLQGWEETERCLKWLQVGSGTGHHKLILGKELISQ